MTDERDHLKSLYESILSYNDDKSIEVAAKAIKENVDLYKIMETAISAISKVGENFDKGVIFVPELMLAGMAMEQVMSLVQEELLSRGKVITKRCTIIIGSVAGDVHTIGKDLVAVMCRANGFKVHDIGVNVSAERFISAAKEFSADVVGLSSLMSTTLYEQKEVIEMFINREVRDKYKIIVGGGVCTEKWAKEIGADGYAENAAATVKLINTFIKNP